MGQEQDGLNRDFGNEQFGQIQHIKLNGKKMNNSLSGGSQKNFGEN